MCIFTHCVITLEKSGVVSSSSVNFLGLKTIYFFYYFLQTSKSFNIVVLPFFVKKRFHFFAHLLCKHWVLQPTSCLRDYVIREVGLVQGEHLWLKSISICIFLRKCPICSLILGWDRVELFEAAFKWQFGYNEKIYISWTPHQHSRLIPDPPL